MAESLSLLDVSQKNGFTPVQFLPSHSLAWRTAILLANASKVVAMRTEGQTTMPLAMGACAVAAV